MGTPVVGDTAGSSGSGRRRGALHHASHRSGDGAVAPGALARALGHGLRALGHGAAGAGSGRDRKSTRLNSSHVSISYAVFCLKKKLHSKTIAADIVFV